MPELTANPRMPSDLEALWRRIEAYALDQPAVADPFSARLAREQRWSAEHTRRVIAEYKRFVLLAVTPSHGVTPSDAVDQVWHAHLTYSREYWETFCGRVLGRPLHHAPGSGDADERLEHWSNYAQTLERYLQVFGQPPPADIWPPAARRFGGASARVNTRQNLIVSWRSLHGAIGIAAACLPGLPLLPHLLHAHGLVVIALGLAAQALALLGAESLRARPLPEAATGALTIHAYEATFLSRGVDCVADAVIANLVARHSLSWSEGRVRQQGLFADPHPLESAAYSEVGNYPGGMELALLQSFVSASTRDLRTRLRGTGLTQVSSITAACLLVLVVPGLLMATAVARQQGVGWAVLGCVLALILARYRYWNAAGATALGKSAFESFRRSHESLNDESQRTQLVPRGDLPAVIALSGLEALRHFELGALADALLLNRPRVANSRGPNTGAGDDSAGDHSGDDGGGDHGGGCGGCAGGCGCG
jgi:uncharacterized protein (TIGR04222 family)